MYLACVRFPARTCCFSLLFLLLGHSLSNARLCENRISRTTLLIFTIFCKSKAKAISSHRLPFIFQVGQTVMYSSSRSHTNTLLSLELQAIKLFAITDLRRVHMISLQDHSNDFCVNEVKPLKQSTK